MGKEQDIFDSEIEAEEAASPTVVSETTEQPPAEPAASQPPAGEQQPPAAEGAAPQQDPQPTPPVHHVPLTELLNTRERAQAAERERDEFKRRVEAFERERQAKPAEVPDVFADPNAYTQHLQTAFQSTVQEVKLDFDLQLAEVRHGDTFKQAWESFLGEVGTGQNPQLYHRVMNARSPGEAIVGWFKQEQVLREVGNDPAAYRQKLQDDLLKDPAFIAKALEQARGQAAGAPNGSSRPQNVTRLPSLNRAPSAASAHDADDGDDSEEAVFAAGRRK